MRTTPQQITDAYCERGTFILNQRSLAAISTLGVDGWPHTMMISYANDGYKIYFCVERNSQEYANMQHDNRISLAVGNMPDARCDRSAVFAGARAHEVTEPEERALASMLLRERPLQWPEWKEPGKHIAVICAECSFISVVSGSYDPGPGHRPPIIDLPSQSKAGGDC